MSGKVDAMVALYNVLPEKDRYTMIQPWSLAVNHHNEYRPRILKPAGSTETEPVPVAGICDHILAMEQLVKWWDREQMRTVIDADNFETFRYAVKTGNVSLLYFLYNLAKETLSNESFDDILSAQGYECFIEAARLGDMEILRLLWSWADRQKQSEMLQSWRSNLMRQSKTLARRNATTAAANKQDIDRYNVQTVNDFIAQLEKGGAVANETLNMTDIITPIEAAALQELLDLPEKHTKDPLEMDRQALSHFFKCIQSQKPLQLKTIINSQPGE